MGVVSGLCVKLRVYGYYGCWDPCFVSERIGDRSVIIRLSGPLKECYAKDNGLGKDLDF